MRTQFSGMFLQSSNLSSWGDMLQYWQCEAMAGWALCQFALRWLNVATENHHVNLVNHQTSWNVSMDHFFHFPYPDGTCLPSRCVLHHPKMGLTPGCRGFLWRWRRLFCSRDDGRDVLSSRRHRGLVINLRLCFYWTLWDRDVVGERVCTWSGWWISTSDLVLFE